MIQIPSIKISVADPFNFDLFREITDPVPENFNFCFTLFFIYFYIYGGKYLGPLNISLIFLKYMYDILNGFG